LNSIELDDKIILILGEVITPHKRCFGCGNRILTGNEDCCRRCGGLSANEIYSEKFTWYRKWGLKASDDNTRGDFDID